MNTTATNGMTAAKVNERENRTKRDMVKTLIRIEFEHDGRMTPDDAREYVRGRVMRYAYQTHTIDEGTRICDVLDLGEPKPEPRPTFAEVARDEVESRYNNGDTTFTAAVAIAEAISKAVAATHGKGNAARYMLDTIAYYVQGHCNTVLND